MIDPQHAIYVMLSATFCIVMLGAIVVSIVMPYVIMLKHGYADCR
jgi:hypothetical protein